MIAHCSYRHLRDKALQELADLWQRAGRKPFASRLLVQQRLNDVLKAHGVASVLVKFTVTGTRLVIGYRSFREMPPVNCPDSCEEIIKYTGPDFQPRSIMIDVSENPSRCRYIDLDAAIYRVIKDWIRSQNLDWPALVYGSGYADFHVRGNNNYLCFGSVLRGYDEDADQLIDIATGNIIDRSKVPEQLTLAAV